MHIGILSLIIFVDRIDIISLVAVAYDTPIPFCSHATDENFSQCQVSCIYIKIDEPIEHFSWYPRFRIHYASRYNRNFNDSILFNRLNKLKRKAEISFILLISYNFILMPRLKYISSTISYQMNLISKARSMVDLNRYI